jgi:hypothetical protein
LEWDQFLGASIPLCRLTNYFFLLVLFVQKIFKLFLKKNSH